MDFRATKDTYEREEEEAERLVRPAPKVKPPRHDKRREHLHVGPEDPEDEDLSLNYKTVGGSTLAHRILQRFSEETVVVKNKKLDEKVWVRPETLHKDPGKYQKVSPTEPEEEDEGDPRPPAHARKPARPYRHKDPLPHPEWRERRSLPDQRVKPAKPPKAVKRVPPFPVPKPEKEPKEKEPGWVPSSRNPSGRYASIGARVLARYLEAKALPSKYVKVKHKETGKTVRVTENTLKKTPGAYEKITEEQEEAEFLKQRDQLEELSSQHSGLKRVLDELKKKGPAYQQAEAMSEAGIGHYDFYHELAKQKKWPEGIETVGDLIGILEAGKPKGAPKPKTESVPKTEPEPKPSSGLRRPGLHDTPQEAPVRTQPSAEAPPKAEPPPAKEKPAEAPPAAKKPHGDTQESAEAKPAAQEPEELKDEDIEEVKSGPPKPPPSKGDAAPPKSKRDLPPPKSAPASGEQAPPSEKSPPSRKAPPSKPKPSEKAPASEKPAAPKEKTWDTASPAERRTVTNRIREMGLPKATTEKLLSLGLHPRDLHPVIDTLQVAGERSVPKDAKKFIETLGDKYETNPKKVKPPKEGLGVDPATGQAASRPYDELSPEEQETAMRAHRAKVVGLSLAANALVAKSLEKQTGTPPDLAQKLADVMFRKPAKDGSGEDWTGDAYEGYDDARKTFAESMTTGKPVKDVKKLLNSVAGNPAAEKVAVAYCQAQDYKEAQQRFWDSKSPDAFSEQDSPAKILAGIDKATKFLSDREKAYPPGSIVDSASSRFRERVTKFLANLSPAKYEAIEDGLRERETADYEVAAKTYEANLLKAQSEAIEKYWKDYDQKAKALKEWDKLQKKTEKENAKLKGGPYRIMPPRPPELPTPYAAKEETDVLLREISLKLPKPKEPEGYIPTAPASKKKRRKEVDSEWSYWDKAAFSTCTPVWAMAKSSHERQAVYWGVPVDREGITPYPDWTQVHQRDLGKRDYAGLLRAAKEWLGSPVLSTSVEGIERDTQVRAALDLAFRSHEDGRYSVGVHPMVYNYLLAKLAGESVTETLLTVRGASGGSVYAPTGESTAMKPSAQVRAFAAKIAATNPEIAFDLAALSTKIAEDEQKKDDKEEDKEEKGKAFPGAAPPFGKDKKAADEEKKEGQDEPKDEQKTAAQDEPKEGEQEQKKEAYVALRSACIRTASSNPAAKAALLPVLQLIKKLG